MNVKPPARMRVALLVTVPLYLALPASAQECETLVRGDRVRFHVADDPTAPPGRFEGVFVSQTEAEVSYTPPAGEEVQTMPLDVVVGLDKRCPASRVGSALGRAPLGALVGVITGGLVDIFDGLGESDTSIWAWTLGGAGLAALWGIVSPRMDWTAMPVRATATPGPDGSFRLEVSFPLVR